MSNIEIEIRRSKRRTVSLEVTTDTKVIVRVPLKFPERDVPEILSRHKKWIEKALERVCAKKEMYPELTEEEKMSLKESAKAIIPVKVRYYSELTGLIPTGIKITSAEKRFGSCSGKNSLCFSYLLMRYPETCIDYVVLHEIAHIKIHNHSKEFYNFIERYMPDYRERVKMLKNN